MAREELMLKLNDQVATFLMNNEAILGGVKEKMVEQFGEELWCMDKDELIAMILEWEREGHPTKRILEYDAIQVANELVPQYGEDFLDTNPVDAYLACQFLEWWSQNYGGETEEA